MNRLILFQGEIKMETEKSIPMTTQAVADTLPPLVRVISPNGGEIFTAGKDTVNILWDSQDDVEVAYHRIRLSRSGPNGPFELIADFIPGNQESYRWLVSGPGTSRAVIQVVAVDHNDNKGRDNSDTPFIIMPAM
jgi:hypothetical protein